MWDSRTDSGSPAGPRCLPPLTGADVRYVWGPEGSDVRRDEDRNGVIRRRDRARGSGSGSRSGSGFAQILDEGPHDDGQRQRGDDHSRVGVRPAHHENRDGEHDAHRGDIAQAPGRFGPIVVAAVHSTMMPLSARCHADSGFRPHHREAPTQAGDGCGELCAVDGVDRFEVAFLTIDPPDVWRTRAGARCGPCL